MGIRSLRWLWLVLLLVGAAPSAETPAADEEKKPTGASSALNSEFVDPELDVDKWIDRFEGESREVFAARNEVLQATGIRAGSRIADIGAGTGFYTRLFAETAGPGGWVYAVELSPRFLEHINQWVDQLDVENVTAILGRTEDISLPAGSVDLAFVCDTYHHFEAVESTLASIRRALAPGGVLVIIDFEKIEGKSSDFIMGHVRAGKEVFRAEIEAAGFAFVEEVKIPGFEENYFLKFEKVGNSPCLQGESYDDFDFWVGDWDVHVGGRKRAENRITKEMNGCIIRERYHNQRGYEGESINYYDPESGQWKQNWVDRQGGIVRYSGGLESEGVMQMEGANTTPDGKTQLARVTWTLLPDGKVHHVIHQSTDGGETWKVYFDGTYVQSDRN